MKKAILGMMVALNFTADGMEINENNSDFQIIPYREVSMNCGPEKQADSEMSLKYNPDTDRVEVKTRRASQSVWSDPIAYAAEKELFKYDHNFERGYSVPVYDIYLSVRDADGSITKTLVTDTYYDNSKESRLMHQTLPTGRYLYDDANLRSVAEIGKYIEVKNGFMLIRRDGSYLHTKNLGYTDSESDEEAGQKASDQVGNIVDFNRMAQMVELYKTEKIVPYRIVHNDNPETRISPLKPSCTSSYMDDLPSDIRFFPFSCYLQERAVTYKRHDGTIFTGWEYDQILRRSNKEVRVYRRNGEQWQVQRHLGRTTGNFAIWIDADSEGNQTYYVSEDEPLFLI